MPFVNSETFETLSTTTDDHHLFYPDMKIFRIYISKRTPTITWPSPLHQHVEHLIIKIPRISSIWNSLLTIGEYNISFIYSEEFLYQSQ
jgi:hypothetical protein